MKKSDIIVIIGIFLITFFVICASVFLNSDKNIKNEDQNKTEVIHDKNGTINIDDNFGVIDKNKNNSKKRIV